MVTEASTLPSPSRPRPQRASMTEHLLERLEARYQQSARDFTALPKSAHPGAKKALAEIWGAEDKPHALAAVKAFEAAYGARFPKATAKITDDEEELLAFYDYPAEHWGHLRTSNPIESTFSPVEDELDDEDFAQAATA